MKKTYIAPVCTHVGKVMTQVICASDPSGLKIGGLEDGLDTSLKPGDGKDADGNSMGWDSFDKGY